MPLSAINARGAVQEVRINHGGHGVPRSFDTKIIFSSVKLRVLRGKKFFLDNPVSAQNTKKELETICQRRFHKAVVFVLSELPVFIAAENAP